MKYVNGEKEVKKVSAALLLLYLHLPHVLLTKCEALRLLHNRFPINSFTDNPITLTNIHIVLNRSPYIPNSISSRPFLHLPLIHPHLHVALIPYQQINSLGTFGPSHLVPFRRSIVKGFRFSKVEDHHNALTTVEVCRYYRTVLFLARSIPNE